MKKAILNHRNTSIAGAAMIAVAIGQMLLGIFDGDASTNPDFNVVVAQVVAGIGLFLAGDGDKSG